MAPTVVSGLVLTGAGLIVTLYARRLDNRTLLYVGKPAASLGFLMVAMESGALGSGYGLWVFTGLVLSLLGDVLLMFEARVFFLAGLVAFLIGHMAYISAFLVLGVSTAWSVTAMAGAALLAWVVIRWLLPHVETAMRVPVLGYATVISLMISLAVGTRGVGHTPLIVTGAALFYVSDLFVARDRFVNPSLVNELLGLPLYYGGQVLLALSVAG